MTTIYNNTVKFTAESITKANDRTLTANARSAFHPDRYINQPQWVIDRATKLIVEAQAYIDIFSDAKKDAVDRNINRDLLRNMLLNFLNGSLFVEPEPEVDVEAELKKYVEKTGANRTKARAWLFAMHNIEGDDASALIDKVLGAGRTQDKETKEKAIKIVIAGKAANKTNKVIVSELMAALNWKKSTADTLLSYYSYMQEYARQVNA